VIQLVDVLARFGATGALGVLRCGASLADVEKVLGRPQPGGLLSDHEENRWPRTWFYRSAELTVDKDLLITMIVVSTWHPSPVTLPVRERDEYARLRTGVTYGPMTRALDRIGCGWERENRYDLETIYLTTKPADDIGVSFVLNASAPGDPPLHKVLAYRTLKDS